MSGEYDRAQNEAQKKSATGWLAFGGGAVLVLGAWLVFGMVHHHQPALGLSQATSVQVSNFYYTLDAGKAPALAQQAQACTMPLATISVWHDPGVADEPVQIQSGSYTSPSFMLTGTPQPMVLPYPAPRPTGAGTLTILGNDKGVELALSPGASFANITGAVSLNVTWSPGAPCS